MDFGVLVLEVRFDPKRVKILRLTLPGFYPVLALDLRVFGFQSLFLNKILTFSIESL